MATATTGFRAAPASTASWATTGGSSPPATDRRSRSTASWPSPRASSPTSVIATPGNAQQATINVSGRLTKSVDLTPANVQLPNGIVAPEPLFRPNFADDVIYGGLGDDFLHGGAGDDAISGAEALAMAYAQLWTNRVGVGAERGAQRLRPSVQPGRPAALQCADERELRQRPAGRTSSRCTTSTADCRRSCSTTATGLAASGGHGRGVLPQLRAERGPDDHEPLERHEGERRQRRAVRRSGERLDRRRQRSGQHLRRMGERPAERGRRPARAPPGRTTSRTTTRATWIARSAGPAATS